MNTFHHLQKDKQCKQRHSLKLDKKRRESSKRNYYIISPRVIIKAIIIISVGQSVGLLIPRSSVRFRPELKKLKTQIYMDLRYIDPQARVLNYCYK